MFKAKLVGALVAPLLLISIVVPMAARAAGALTVTVGEQVPRGYSARVYAPTVNGTPTIQVHKGDVVNLVGGMGLLPIGYGPEEFYAQYAQGLDQPFGLVASDPDPDLPPSNDPSVPGPTDAPYKLSDFGVGNVTLNCGATEQDACPFDGHGSPPADVFDPGDRSATHGDTFVQINANSGDTVWGIANLPPSEHTVLRIDVVPNSDAVTTQVSVDDAFATLHAHDVDEASALDGKLNARSSKHKTAAGKTVYDAYAGYDTEVLRLFSMYPRRLVVPAGATVRWHFDQLEGQIHSVVFPLKEAVAVSNDGFLPVCDPDGDQGTANDSFTVNFETFTCPSGTLEIDLLRELTAQSGNGKYSGLAGDFENSGLRGPLVPSAPGLAGGESSYDIKFTKASGAAGFTYACGVHGKEMKGTVVVKR